MSLVLDCVSSYVIDGKRERESKGTPSPPVDERGAAWSEQNNFQKQKNL